MAKVWGDGSNTGAIAGTGGRHVFMFIDRTYRKVWQIGNTARVCTVGIRQTEALRLRPNASCAKEGHISAVRLSAASVSQENTPKTPGTFQIFTSSTLVNLILPKCTDAVPICITCMCTYRVVRAL